MNERREIGRSTGDLWTPETWTMRRRELLQAGAGLALGVALAGCGIGRGIQGDVNRRIEPKVDGDLFYFNYSQYIDPALVKEFEKRYDVRVIESYFDSMEGMLAKLRAGNAYDVMFPTAEYVQRLVQQEQLLRIPRDKLENIDNIYGYFDDPWYDPDSAHSVPYSLYITGIGYRADILDNMTGSWDDLGNEEAAGRIYVLDDYQEALAAGNLRNGYDMNTVVESELDATRDWLVEPEAASARLLGGHDHDHVERQRLDPAPVERRHRQHPLPRRRPRGLPVPEDHPGRVSGRAATRS